MKDTKTAADQLDETVEVLTNLVRELQNDAPQSEAAKAALTKAEEHLENFGVDYATPAGPPVLFTSYYDGELGEWRSTREYYHEQCEHDAAEVALEVLVRTLCGARYKWAGVEHRTRDHDAFAKDLATFLEELEAEVRAEGDEAFLVDVAAARARVQDHVAVRA